MLKRMQRFFLGLMTLALMATGCPEGSEDGEKGPSESSSDPHAALRAGVSENGVRCDAKTCCWDDCQYEQIVCGQQNGLYVGKGSTLDGFDLDSAPRWWREQRYYLVSDYEMNVFPGRTDNPTPEAYYVGAFCEEGSFHTAYTHYIYFDDPAAFAAFLESGPPDSDCSFALDFCDGFCTPNCTGKECGNNGCGGSCGTCGAGMFCSASGVCTESAGGGGSACDECLSVCRGLPGCCDGCGCMCEDECGMCF